MTDYLHLVGKHNCHLTSLKQIRLTKGVIEFFDREDTKFEDRRDYPVSIAWLVYNSNIF